MSRQFVNPLLFKVYPSKIARNFIAAIFILCVISLYLINSDFIIVTLILCVFLIYLVRKALTYNRECELHWQGDGSWLLTENGTTTPAVLSENSVITTYFSLLNFALESNGCRNVMIFTDNIDPDKFRCLRVRAKVQGIKSSSHDTLA